jgi:hypothetical protein
MNYKEEFVRTIARNKDDVKCAGYDLNYKAINSYESSVCFSKKIDNDTELQSLSIIFTHNEIGHRELIMFIHGFMTMNSMIQAEKTN